MKIDMRYKLLLLSLLSSSLLSCGGGNGISVVEGGISGTGITLGRITKFGSIYVNGVRFNVDSASFTRDGKPSVGQSEFSLGEYIMIKGSFDKNGTAGTATEVTFTDILEGAITQVTSDGATIEVLGQSVIASDITTLLGFSTLGELVAGNIVEVSGFKDAEGLINATSIKLKQNNFVIGVSENELKGVIATTNTVDKSFIIGNIIVDYSSATLKGFGAGELQVGQKVEVKSDSEIVGNTLVAIEIELEDGEQSILSNTTLEVEGIVTRFVSLLDFDVNGIAVTTDSKTKYKKGNSVDIGLNSILEVKGKVNVQGVLLAEEIEFEDSKSGGSGSGEDDRSQNDGKNDLDGDKEGEGSEEGHEEDNNVEEDEPEEDDAKGDSEENDNEDGRSNEHRTVI